MVEKRYYAEYGNEVLDRVQVEGELRAQDLVFENIYDGIFMTDLTGKITRWNPAAERMFGYYKDEIFRKTLSALATNIIKGQLRDGQWIGEMDFMRKDGTKGICETTIIPLRDTDDTITAMCGVCHDITESRKAQEDLKRSYDQLEKTLMATVNALASAAEMRDPYTAGHQRRVTVLACAIATEMGLTDEQFAGLRLAGLIHDIGKINIPAEILNKPGRISEIEFNIIKTHPETGYNIVKDIEFPWPVARIILQHHERLNGSGYPRGLKEGEIMQEARILAVADVLEAMASHRPYRPSLGVDAALAEIVQAKGVLYDPEVVAICQRLFLGKGFQLQEGNVCVAL
jgi:PAS domain S-box-containing protein/putative nucleotidyltransferase with HDIG domain